MSQRSWRFKGNRSLRDWAQDAMPKPIYDYLRYWWRKVFNRGYYALNDLDRKLERYLPYDGGFFVELGANDGYTQSNSLYFEKRKKWRGVLVEPAPHLFLKCCYFRRGSGSKIFCNACVPFGFSEKYVDIEYANLMSVSANLESDIKDKAAFDRLAAKLTSSSERALRFGAVARTLTSILDEADAPQLIDLLSLDVEGAELAVLNGVDFRRYTFKYILIECRDIVRVEGFLSSFGYKIIDKLSYHDYLFSPGKKRLVNDGAEML